MGFDKAIQHHKEHRKPYKGGKAVDPSCRNHGGCLWCLGNRTYGNRKARLVSEEKLEEYEKEGTAYDGKE